MNEKLKQALKNLNESVEQAKETHENGTLLAGLSEAARQAAVDILDEARVELVEHLKASGYPVRDWPVIEAATHQLIQGNEAGFAAFLGTAAQEAKQQFRHQDGAVTYRAMPVVAGRWSRVKVVKVPSDRNQVPSSTVIWTTPPADEGPISAPMRIDRERM